jgi:hypothetical protein
MGRVASAIPPDDRRGVPQAADTPLPATMKLALDESGSIAAVAPAPLLPLEAPAPARSPTGRPSASPLSYRATATVEETTEVHVSIGRIEVTAVHEAPPPRRPAPKANKPMSLDEYLARREGRGP